MSRVLTLVLAVMFVAACDDGDHRRADVTTVPSPTASATPPANEPRSTTPAPVVTASPTATPATTPGPPTQQPLILGSAAALSGDVALIVQTGCFQCDGPATGLIRLNRDAAGSIRSDPLIHRPEGGRNQPYISSLAVGVGGYEMAVTLCSRGYCGGLAEVTPDAETTMLRSRDGGITWEEAERRAGAYGVVAIAEEGVIIAGPFTPARGTALRLLPGGQAVTAPAGAENGHPVPAGKGLLWRTSDGRRVLREDGSILFEIEDARGSISAVLPEPGGERIAVAWWDGNDSHLTMLDAQGRRRRTANLGSGFAAPGAWLDSERLLGNVYVPTSWLPTPVAGFFVEQLPAVIDLARGEVAPLIEPFLRPPLFNGRNHIEAVTHGPFVRVATAGDCLNVREQPDARAPVLACAADRVLLRDLREEREAAGVYWRRVRLPGGRAGWASAAYLER